MDLLKEPPKTVFITGATGFIGSHIARRYLAAGYRVEALTRTNGHAGLLADVADQITWYEGDILDIPSLEAAIRGGIDVVHAAAVVSFAPKDHAQMDQINVEGTANVVNVCLKAGIHKLGYVSSVAALGRPENKTGTNEVIRLDESQKWEDSPNNSAYAKSKYRAELEVWRGVAEGLQAVMVNPSIVLGAGDWNRSSTRLFKYVYDEKPFYPVGLVNYVDVVDVVESLFRLMEADSIPEGRFVLNGGTIPYKELLEQMAVALHKRPPRMQMPRWLTHLAWPVEAVRSWITGSEPLITRETARSASSLYAYDGRAITQAIDLQYRPLSETLMRSAKAYVGL
ncbi:MAG: NAD-dependent epimerase/dehydratase family protein [Cytophagales bacterium]|nr:MAG: NAD-dependent epimerase/dehydratase family protein [Cytophagales bacterium]